MENRLKPCPFCGSSDIELRPGMLWNGAVHCNNCSADVVFNAVKLFVNENNGWEESVTEGWNKRVFECNLYEEMT